MFVWKSRVKKIHLFVSILRVLELHGLTEEAVVSLDRSKASPLEPGEIPIDSVAIPSSPTPNGTSDGK